MVILKFIFVKLFFYLDKFHDDYYEEQDNRKPYMEKVCF